MATTFEHKLFLIPDFQRAVKRNVLSTQDSDLRMSSAHLSVTRLTCPSSSDRSPSSSSPLPLATLTCYPPPQFFIYSRFLKLKCLTFTI